MINIQTQIYIFFELVSTWVRNNLDFLIGWPGLIGAVIFLSVVIRAVTRDA